MMNPTWCNRNESQPLEHHLKAWRMPTFLREYDKMARQFAHAHQVSGMAVLAAYFSNRV